MDMALAVTPIFWRSSQVVIGCDGGDGGWYATARYGLFGTGESWVENAFHLVLPDGTMYTGSCCHRYPSEV